MSAVVAGLGKVKDAFVTAELEAHFAAYVRRLLGPALERIGEERRPGEPEAVSMLRPQLLLWLGADGGDPAGARPRVGGRGRLLADPASVDPSVAARPCGCAALPGDRALFDEYRQRIETATVPAERARFLDALGYFRDARAGGRGAGLRGRGPAAAPGDVRDPERGGHGGGPGRRGPTAS